MPLNPPRKLQPYSIVLINYSCGGNLESRSQIARKYRRKKRFHCSVLQNQICTVKSMFYKVRRKWGRQRGHKSIAFLLFNVHKILTTMEARKLIQGSFIPFAMV
jgi:hypothetical protein